MLAAPPPGDMRHQTGCHPRRPPSPFRRVPLPAGNRCNEAMDLRLDQDEREAIGRLADALLTALALLFLGLLLVELLWQAAGSRARWQCR